MENNLSESFRQASSYQDRLKVRQFNHAKHIRRRKPTWTGSAVPGSDSGKVIPLSEHFENFTDVVSDVVTGTADMFTEILPEPVQEFLGIGKAIKKRIASNSAAKSRKKMAKADLIQAKADAERIRATGEANAALEAARAQTAQTNQLQSQVAPLSQPSSVENSPQYQSLPEVQSNTNQWTNVNQEQEQAQNKISTGALPPTPQKKKNTTLYIVFALAAAAGIYFYMKNKK